jgi:F-type H+-transporting ATPase subunit a
MSKRQQTILKAGVVLAIFVVLALLLPVKPLPPIEAGPKVIAEIPVGGSEFLISNSMLVSWIITAILIIVAFASTRHMELVPSGLQNAVEAIIEAINGLVSDIAGERGRRFFPIVATIFLYLILINWTEVLPGVGAIGVWRDEVIGDHLEHVLVPIFRTSSSDLNVTVALAIISVFMTQVYSIRALGFGGYLTRWFNFGRLGQFLLALVGRRPRKGLGGLLFWGIIDVMVGFVELFSEFVKIITFSFRLFGNLLAGEVILIVMAYLFPQILPIPFFLFEAFVGFIQAFVFAILTLVFMLMATQKHASGETQAEL